MDLHRMIVAEQHVRASRSCDDFSAESLTLAHPSPLRFNKKVSLLALWIGRLMIRTGQALEDAAQPEQLTPKSSRYIYS